MLAELLYDVARFKRDRAALEARGRAIARSAGETLRIFGGDSPPLMSRVSVTDPAAPKFWVDVETLGHDNRPGRLCVPAFGPIPLDGMLIDIAKRHRDLQDLARELEAIRASCLVDGMTMSILEAVGIDLADMLDRLDGNASVEFDFAGPTGALYSARSFWLGGAAFTSLEEPDRPIRFDGVELTLPEEKIPLAFVAALADRPLSALAIIPWAHTETVISGASSVGDWLYVRTRSPLFAIVDGKAQRFDRAGRRNCRNDAPIGYRSQFGGRQRALRLY